MGDDTQADLGVTLTCEATETSPAGTPVAITGTSASANYDVTVTAGTLTINKATITSVDDPNIWTAILANSDSNVSADALLDAVKDGRTSLSATYANGSTTVTADWTLTEGTWDRKGRLVYLHRYPDSHRHHQLQLRRDYQDPVRYRNGGKGHRYPDRRRQCNSRIPDPVQESGQRGQRPCRSGHPRTGKAGLRSTRGNRCRHLRRMGSDPRCCSGCGQQRNGRCRR